MRISVILPTKDRGPDVNLTLDALIRQDLPKSCFEVLIIDNASNPSNASALRDYSGRHPDVMRYLSEPEPGLNRARNAGVKAARGGLVAFLDDDAVPHPRWLTALLEVFDARPDIWAVGGRVISQFTSPPPGWLDERFKIYLSDFDRGEDLRQLRYDDYPRGANMAFRHEAFEQCGAFNPRLDRRGDLLLSYGDIEMCYRVEQAGHVVAYAPDAEVRHLIRGDRLSFDWFDRRAYWQGRSQALFERLHFGAAQLLRKLPYRMIRSLASGDRHRKAMHRGLCSGTFRHLL